MKKRKILCGVVLLLLAIGWVSAVDRQALVSGAQKIAEKSADLLTGTLAVVYRPAEMREVQVLEDIPFSSGRTMDVYYPPDFAFNHSLPVVLVVNSFGNMGLKNSGRCIDWGLLIASSGLAAVAYEPVYAEKDTQLLLNYMMENCGDLNLDPEKIGLLAYCSNSLLGFKIAMQQDAAYSDSIKVSANICGYVPATDIYRCDVPMLIVRAGRCDSPGLNDSITAFLACAESNHMPCEVIEHSGGTPTFDVVRLTGQDNLYSLSSLHPDDCAILKRLLNRIKFYMEE